MRRADPDRDPVGVYMGIQILGKQFEVPVFEC